MAQLSSTPNALKKLETVNQHQLEEWGAHCSLPSCNMLDFLPLKCLECEKLFCSSHFKPSLISSDSNHLCEKFILKSKNAESINKSTTASRTNKTQSNKKCSYAKCRTLMFSPITCKSCQLSYCPTHRLEQDHLCKPSSSISKSVPSSIKPITSSTTIPGYSNLIKNLLVNKTNDQQPNSSSITQSQSHDQSINFNSNFLLNKTITKIKMNQRNKSEIESQQKALEFRMKNGILTEADKLTLQQQQEKHASHELNRRNHDTTTTSIIKTKNQSECLIV